MSESIKEPAKNNISNEIGEEGFLKLAEFASVKEPSKSDNKISEENGGESFLKQANIVLDLESKKMALSQKDNGLLSEVAVVTTR